MKDVLVFFGGVSPEHDISIITGVLVVNSIDKSKWRAVPIYVDKNGLWFTGEELKNIDFYKNFSQKRLKHVCLVQGDNTLYEIKRNKLRRLSKASCAINAMHGANGEDGAICGILQTCGIALASPNAFSSSLAIDKNLTKIFAKALDINTVESVTICKHDFYLDKEGTMLDAVNNLCYPLIVKPKTLGSSIGIGVCSCFQAFESALENAFIYDESVVVEKYLAGSKDINIAVYQVDGEMFVSKCEKPITANEILTFNDKYVGGKSAMEKEFPAKIDKSIENEIVSIAKKMYLFAGFAGIVRFDFLLCDNLLYLNEINAVPGSLAYYLFCEKISDFSALLTKLLDESLFLYAKKNSVRKTFNSSIVLTGIKGIKAKK